ncbi:uncharacterized protein DS421_13g410500 [Arachis hypogaea]|nr:uncharacterized protein DS421_13g410500 [Arachis hypogaea]
MAGFGGRRGRDLDGEGGLRGSHVNKDAARAEAGEGAGVGIEEDGANVGGVADDGEDDVRVGGEGEGIIGLVGPHFEEGLGLGRGAVEDGERVAGSYEVGAHGEAHDARTYPAHAGVGWAYGLGSGGGGHVAAGDNLWN